MYGDVFEAMAAGDAPAVRAFIDRVTCERTVAALREVGIMFDEFDATPLTFDEYREAAEESHGAFLFGEIPYGVHDGRVCCP